MVGFVFYLLPLGNISGALFSEVNNEPGHKWDWPPEKGFLGAITSKSSGFVSCCLWLTKHQDELSPIKLGKSSSSVWKPIAELLCLQHCYNQLRKDPNFKKKICLVWEDLLLKNPNWFLFCKRCPKWLEIQFYDCTRIISSMEIHWWQTDVQFAESSFCSIFEDMDICTVQYLNKSLIFLIDNT